MVAPSSDEELVQRLARTFQKHGRELYLVGGTVRDRLLGRPTHDLDFATSAPPEDTRALLLSDQPTSLYSIGEKFGTIGAAFGDTIVEVTTFRSERYQPGSRKPEVRYGDSIQDDLARRDFTINALAEEPISGVLIDLFGGQEDLRAGRIRAVGDPRERFAEDPLRLLRAMRFVAQLDFTLDPRTAEAVARSASLLGQISRERIFDELNRLLLAPQAGRALRLLLELGLLDVFLPEAVDLQRTTQGKRSKDVFEHTVRVVERTRADQVLRWAALLHDIGKPRTIVETGNEIHFPNHERVGEWLSAEILTRLRADSQLATRVGRLAGLHMRANQYEDEWSDGAVRRLVRDAEPDFERLLDLSTADVTSYRAVKIEAAMDRVRRLRERAARLEEEASLEEIKSPLDGNDLMTLFKRPPGPWIKPVKDYLLDQVMEGRLGIEDRESAATLARAFLDGASSIPTGGGSI